MKRVLIMLVVALGLTLGAGCADGANNTPIAEAPTNTAGGLTQTQVPGDSATPTPMPLIVPTATVTVGSSSSSLITGKLLWARDNDVWRLTADSNQPARILEDARHFTWSPDGQRIAFVRGQGRDAELWVSDADGGDQRQLTHNDREDIWPMWSPDGHTIAFTSSAKPLNGMVPWFWRHWGQGAEAMDPDNWMPSAQVWLVNSDGADARRLAPGFAASWAPEGLRLAFHRRDGDDKSYVMVINAEGQNEWRLAANAELEGPVAGGLFYGQLTWSPDGRDLAYGVSSYAMLSDWGLLRKAATLSKDPLAIVGETDGYFARVATSPDGQLIAADYYGGDGRGLTDGLTVFWQGRPGTINFFTERRDVTATKVLNTPKAHSPAWSPDSKRLAYAAANSIWLWDRETLNVAKLVEGVDVDAGLAWSE